MITLDVCIEPLFPELPTEERIERAAAAGYKAIECWVHDATHGVNGFDFGQPRDPKAVRQACESVGVTLSNLVVNPPDDGSIGGAPILRDTHARYLERVEAAIAWGKAAGCTRAITCAGDTQSNLSAAQMRDNVERALGQAAEIAAREEFTLLLEPLNSRVDHIGYWLDSSELGAEIVRNVASPHLRLLFDTYHMQIMHGDIIEHIRQQRDVIGHFHSAAVPGRGEHNTGELNYSAILKAIAATSYDGFFGLEYFPGMADHNASLETVRSHLMEAGVCR